MFKCFNINSFTCYNVCMKTMFKCLFLLKRQPSMVVLYLYLVRCSTIDTGSGLVKPRRQNSNQAESTSLEPIVNSPIEIVIELRKCLKNREIQYLFECMIFVNINTVSTS